MSHFISSRVVNVLVLVGIAGVARAATPASRPASNPFYVFDFCVQDEKHPTFDSQAKVVKELGAEGVSYGGMVALPEKLAALDRYGLKLFTIYTGVNLDGDKPGYDPRLLEAMKVLAGRETMIWIYITSSKHALSSEEGDPAAVALIREIADEAAKSHLRIALYPHARDWLERVEDAVRLAKKVDRPNVGVTFNLCHWLKVDRHDTLERRLQLAKPYLLQVSINGADTDGKDWTTLIQPLGQGSFDVGRVLALLRKQGYTGPICLQCYGVKGDKYENLKGSMAAWRKMSTASRPG